MQIKRYTDDELVALLNNLESDRIERKRNFKNDSEKCRQAVCAFSNDLPNHNEPGILFIGAEDDGSPSNLPVTDELLKNISDMKYDGNILPIPSMNVEKRMLKGCEMAIVTVEPSDTPPVRYKGQIWVRTGPRRGLASAQDERLLNEKRQFKDQQYDTHPISHATLEDLSRAYFEDEYLPLAFSREVLEANNRTYEERLSSLKFIHSIEDPIPTIAGILAVGKNPGDLLGFNSQIQFVRFNGTDIGAVLDVKAEEEVNGRFETLVKNCRMIFDTFNMVHRDATVTPNIISRDYPQIAFEQILFNAIMHRNYAGTNAPIHFYWWDDRIEIWNTGGPYGDATVENFGKPGCVAYRNAVIADVFKALGFVHHFGTGIRLAQASMEANGNPPIEFKVDANSVTAILRTGAGTGK